MLGKLLKHEWKTTWKIPTIMLIALFVMSIITGLTFRSSVFQNSDESIFSFFMIMIWLLFYFLVIGVSLGITIYMIVRFYKSMFTDEGYLTHTLPVSTHELLLSKMLNMALWQLITMLAICASFLLLGFMAKMFLTDPQVTTELQEFLDALRDDFGGVDAGNMIISILLLAITGCFSGSLTMIGSVSLGQMMGKHKILGSIGGYFLIYTIMQTLMMLLMIPSMFMAEYNTVTNVSHLLVRTYYGASGISAAMSIALYFLSYYLIDKKLNLD